MWQLYELLRAEEVHSNQVTCASRQTPKDRVEAAH